MTSAPPGLRVVNELNYSPKYCDVAAGQSAYIYDPNALRSSRRESFERSCAASLFHPVLSLTSPFLNLSLSLSLSLACARLPLQESTV